LWVPFPGGAERFVSNIAHEMLKRGHEIHVLTSYQRAEDIPEVSVHFRDIGVHDRHEEGKKTIEEVIHEIRPDIIFTHHFFAYEFKEWVTQFLMPVVQVVHNNKKIPGAALGVFNSQYTRDHAVSNEQDMVILPPAYGDIVAEIHGDAIGFVKPIHHKGVDYVYHIAAHFPDRKFLILRGEWQDIEDIREMPNVSFMEPVKDIREFYSRCRLMLMPSWAEDAGTIPQEAALNGIPCISTDVMGLPETNKGGIVLRRDESLWWAEIEKLDDPLYYQSVVDRQREYVNSIHWDEKFDHLSNLLPKLKFIDHYQHYNSIGRDFLTLYPTQKERETYLLENAYGEILDLGCNDCGLWENYPDRSKVHGIDLSADAVATACLKGFDVKEGRAENTGYADKSFDTVAMSELIEHVESPEALLQEATRVSRGQVIGTVPRPTGGWGAWKFDPDHIRFWEREELEALMSKYGQATVLELNSDFFSFKILV
jgi:glycosyltransferase involved in cell wall biosynthesis